MQPLDYNQFTAVANEGRGLPMEPQYLRIADAVRVFGLGRSTLYRLIRSGSIASVSVQLEGATRGTRLVSVKSLRRFLESLEEGVD